MSRAYSLARNPKIEVSVLDQGWALRIEGEHELTGVTLVGLFERETARYYEALEFVKEREAITKTWRAIGESGATFDANTRILTPRTLPKDHLNTTSVMGDNAQHRASVEEIPEDTEPRILLRKPTEEEWAAMNAMLPLPKSTTMKHERSVPAPEDEGPELKRSKTDDDDSKKKN